MNDPAAGGEYVPFQTAGAGPAEPARPRPGKSTTRSSLVVALLPIAVLAIVISLATASGGETTWATVGAVSALAVALSFILAREDQRALARRHFTLPTPPLLALLPVAYLFTRGNRAYRESGEGMGPAWLHLAALLAVAGGIIGLSVIVAVLRELARILAMRLDVG